MNLKPSPKQPPRHTTAYVAGISILLFVVALIPRLWQLNYFIMVDESLWFERSSRFMQALLSGNLAQTVQTGHPGVSTMWAGTVGLWLYHLQTSSAGLSLAQFAANAPNLVPSLEILSLLRLPVAIISAITVALVFVLARQLLGNLSAFIGAGLIAFEPFFVAHSRVLHHDALAACGSIIAVLGWLVYQKRAQKRYLLIAGAGVALAVLSKISALFLLGFAGLVLLPKLWHARKSLRTEGWSILKPWFMLSGIALLVAVIAWPALWSAPQGVWQTLFEFVTRESGPHARGSFFMGQPVPNPGLLFYPLGLAYYLSPFTLIGAVLAVLGLSLNRKKPSPNQSEIWVFWLLLFSLSFVLYISFISKKQMRYSLPAVLSLGVAAGWGYNWVQSKIRWPHTAKLALISGLVIGGQLLLMLSVKPYYSTFFNPLLGGPRQAQKIFPLGRGEGLDETARFLQANHLSENDPAQIAAWYGTTAELLFDENITVKDILHPNFILESDYVIFYINQLQRELVDPGIVRYVQNNLPLLHTATINGLPYATLYQGPALSHPVDPFQPENRLTGKANLSGFDMPEAPYAGAKTTLSLYWINDGISPDEHFYVRLTDTLEQDWAWGSCTTAPPFSDASTWQDNDIIESICEMIVSPGTPPGDYLLRVGLLAPDDSVIGQMNLKPQEGTVTVVHPPEFPADEWIPAENYLNTALNEHLNLIGYTLKQSSTRPGESVSLGLYWRAMAEAMPTYQLQLTLQGDGPAQFAQWQGTPVNGRYPTAGWLNDEVVFDPWRLDIPPNLPGGRYTFTLNLLNPAGRASTAVILPSLEIKGRAHQFELDAPPATSQTAQVGEAIQLMGYNLPNLPQNETIEPGQALSVELIWQALDNIPQNYTVFVQLLNANNEVVAQNDSQPAGGALPTITWAKGEYIKDSHLLELPPALSPGEYRLIVGFYQPETGQRLPVTDPAGNSLGDYVSLNSTLAVR